jgi:hypothetical protein
MECMPIDKILNIEGAIGGSTDKTLLDEDILDGIDWVSGPGVLNVDPTVAHSSTYGDHGTVPQVCCF